jgi:hypothetical protein
MMDAMAISDRERVWVRRLALGVVLVTCAGGAAFVLVDRPPGDCSVVAEMMRTYSTFQAADPVADQRADAEAATANTLQEQARRIDRPELRTAADAFAGAVASSAQAQLAAAELGELDVFNAVLPAVDPAELRAGEEFTTSADILLVACPSAPHPVGLG